MEFIESEAVVDDYKLSFSDSENEEMIDDNNDDFIDNRPQFEDESFYRQIGNQFANQNKNLKEAIFEQNYLLYETDAMQPALYNPVSRDLVTFDNFEGSDKSLQRFKKTLKNFGDSENQLFIDSVIYGIVF